MLLRVRAASLGAAVAKYFCRHQPSLPRFPTNFSSFRYGLIRRMHTAERPSPYQTSGRFADVSRDVLLYSFQSVRFYRWMTLFGAVQFVFWAQMGHFSLQNYVKASERKEKAESASGTLSQLPEGLAGADMVKTAEATPDTAQTREKAALKDGSGSEKSETNEKAMIDALDKPQKWYVKYVMGQMDYNRPYYSLTVGLLYIFVGAGLAYAAMMFSLRSVAQLILQKGGQEITIITYAPFGFTRKFTIPTNDITTKLGRQGARAFLPLKIRKRPLYYLLDMRGTFHNPNLFDVTAGLQRSWRK